MTQAPEPKLLPDGAPLPIDVALARLLAEVGPVGTETLPLEEALGRVLAQALTADLDQPDFRRSMMDGFAVRAADCAAPGAVLTAIGAAPAGRPFDGEVVPGTCVRVMTGGVVPHGADAVVPVERVERSGAGSSALDGSRWRVMMAVHTGRNVAARGSELRAGQEVVSAGSVMDGARIGAAAAAGHATLSVRRRPIATLVPTGDEVVDVSCRPQPGQVRDSNRHAVGGLLRRCGAEVRHLEVAPDRRSDLARTLAQAALNSDLVVTSGGVSMGDFDLVAGALADAGAEVIFHRVALKPGKPLLAAKLGRAIVLGLPGNPVSSYVCALLFGRPLLAALLGADRRSWLSIRLPLAAPLPPSGARAEIRPGRYLPAEGGAAVQPIDTGGSADLTAFASRELLIHRPPNAPQACAGDPVAVWIWPDPA